MVTGLKKYYEAYDTITNIDNIDADGDGVSKMEGLSHMMIEVKPAKPRKVFGALAGGNTEAANNFDYFINDYFLNAIINGEEDINYLNTLQRHNKNSRDFKIHPSWSKVGAISAERPEMARHIAFDRKLGWKCKSCSYSEDCKNMRIAENGFKPRAVLVQKKSRGYTMNKD